MAAGDLTSNMDVFRRMLGLPTSADTAQLDPYADPSQVLTPDRSSVLSALLGPGNPTAASAQAQGYPPDVLPPEPQKSRRDVMGELKNYFAQGTGRGDLNFNQDLGGNPFLNPQESPSPTTLPSPNIPPYGTLNPPTNDQYGGAVSPAPFMPYGSSDPGATGGGGASTLDLLNSLYGGTKDVLGRGAAALTADRSGGAGPYGSGSASSVLQALYGSGSGPPEAGGPAPSALAASPDAAGPGVMSRLNTDFRGLFGGGGGSPAAAAAPALPSAAAPMGVGTIPPLGAGRELFDADGNSLMTPAQLSALGAARPTGGAPQQTSAVGSIINHLLGISAAQGGEGPTPAIAPPGMGNRSALTPGPTPPTPQVAPVTAPSTAPPPTPAASQAGTVVPLTTTVGGPMSPAGQAAIAQLKAAQPNLVPTGGVIDPARTKAIADAAAGASPPALSPVVKAIADNRANGPAAAANAANAPPAAAKPQTTAAEQTLEQGGQFKPNPDGTLAGSLPPSVQGALANHGLKLPSNTWDFLIQLGAGMMAHADRPGMIGVGLGLQEAYAGMTAQQKASYDHSVELMKVNAQIQQSRAQLAVTASNHLLAHEDKVALNAQNEQLRLQSLAIQQQLANQGLANQTFQGNIAQQNADTKAQTEKDRAAAVSQQGEAAFNAAYEKQYADVKGRMPTTLGVPDDAATTRTLAAMAYGPYANRPEVIAAQNRIKQITQEAQANAKAYPNTIPQLQQRLSAYGVNNVTLSPR